MKWNYEWIRGSEEERERKEEKKREERCLATFRMNYCDVLID